MATMTKKEQKFHQDGFMQGYILACATLMRLDSADNSVYELLRCVNSNPEILKDHDCDEDDIQVLIPVIEEIKLRSRGKPM